MRLIAQFFGFSERDSPGVAFLGGVSFGVMLGGTIAVLLCLLG